MNSKDVPSSFPKQKKIKSSVWTSIENNYWLTRMIIRRYIQDMLTYLTNKLSNTKSSFDYNQTILNDFGENSEEKPRNIKSKLKILFKTFYYYAKHMKISFSAFLRERNKKIYILQHKLWEQKKKLESQATDG